MTTIQADQVYTANQLRLDGELGARLNSSRGATEVIGQDVRIVAQDNTATGAPGRATIDAVDQVRVSSGKKIKLTAPVIDFVAQAVIVRPTHEDPEPADLRPGMIWFHSGLNVFRAYDGSHVKTLKFV